ncbi:MAG: hypothetical protein F6J98_02375 [Moorea sp. SIO4G2]|nr:hypothetical protein [Moorena sp. SIO4G2]
MRVYLDEGQKFFTHRSIVNSRGELNNWGLAIALVNEVLVPESLEAYRTAVGEVCDILSFFTFSDPFEITNKILSREWDNLFVATCTIEQAILFAEMEATKTDA